MPIKHRLQRKRPACAPELTRRLTEEWIKPREQGQPVIVLDEQKEGPLHIFVIWDEWQDLDQRERSEIIMDVVEDLRGQHRIPDMSRRTVAMGLTEKEAQRMGIEVA
jgi:hypothetical protein